jgi:ketopantoate reductase
MKVLIVGIGALGGTITARAINAGVTVRLATRSSEPAGVLRRSGLRVSGIGGDARAVSVDVAPIADYGKADEFDLILLATKAQDALEVAPRPLGAPDADRVHAAVAHRRCRGNCNRSGYSGFHPALCAIERSPA